jgi:hypothetical protein
MVFNTEGLQKETRKVSSNNSHSFSTKVYILSILSRTSRNQTGKEA